MTCLACLSLGQQSANLRARNGLSSQSQLGIYLYLETHLTAEFRKHIDVACGLIAEMKIEAFVYLLRLQSFFQDVMSKSSRGHERQIAREREQQNSIQASGFQQAQFLRRRREQLQSGVGPQDSHGMRLESQS